MKTYALVGESGTGKSYNSITLAAVQGLDYIIDDGILINKNKVVAGSSAKKEDNIIDAVKRAVFINDDHCREIQEAIRDNAPEGILVLGTSVKMVEKIRRRLGLPEYIRIFRIEDIASEEDIAKARLTRQRQGKHVIPVPVMEIRKTFSGYFLDPLRVFRKNPASSGTDDKSIVRPTYSYMGEFSVNDTVLCELAAYETSRCEGVERVVRVTVDKVENNVVFNVDVQMAYGFNIPRCSEEIKSRVKESVENYASVYTDAVNVNIRSVGQKK